MPAGKIARLQGRIGLCAYGVEIEAGLLDSIYKGVLETVVNNHIYYGFKFFKGMVTRALTIIAGTHLQL